MFKPLCYLSGMTLLTLDNLDELAEIDDPDLLVDPYHPHNDRYFSSQRDIMRKITHAKSQLKPKQVRVVELALSGLKTAQIAEKIKVTPATVLKHIRHPDAIRLAQLLQHLTQLRDGPKKAHRQHMLYRIAVDNEVNRPAIAISALDQLNKLAGSYEQQGNHGNSINITINGAAMPKGALDKLPETYESRVHLEQEQ